jgi:hypothetical protein
MNAMFEAMLNAKDREHGEIEAEHARKKAAREAEAKREDEEFEARKQRNRAEKETISGWASQCSDDIRALLEGGA